MKISRAPTFFLLFPLFLCALSSSAVTVEELQAKMGESNARLKCVQFHYVQEMTSDLTPEVQKSSGTVYMAQPKKLRIEQGSPEPQMIVSSGKTVFIYTPRFRQVLKGSWERYFSKQSFGAGPLPGFSETLAKLIHKYEWKIAGTAVLDGEGMTVVRLKNPSAGDETVILWVSDSDFIPRRTELVSGTVKISTAIDSIKKNPALPDRLFDFQVPRGATVVKM